MSACSDIRILASSIYEGARGRFTRDFEIVTELKFRELIDCSGGSSEKNSINICYAEAIWYQRSLLIPAKTRAHSHS